MEVTPDTKDWTWVLDETCPECGLDTRLIDPAAIPHLLRANAAEWGTILRRGDSIKQRPAPTVWSPLEYACHVRDVFRTFDMRLRRMLVEDDPLFANWDQDATAAAERYGEQDPATVAFELQVAAESLADRFASVEGPQWQRTGRRSDGALFTVQSLGRYMMHDPLHHIYDVTGRHFAGGVSWSTE